MMGNGTGKQGRYLDSLDSWGHLTYLLINESCVRRTCPTDQGGD